MKNLWNRTRTITPGLRTIQQSQVTARGHRPWNLSFQTDSSGCFLLPMLQTFYRIFVCWFSWIDWSNCLRYHNRAAPPSSYCNLSASHHLETMEPPVEWRFRRLYSVKLKMAKVTFIYDQIPTNLADASKIEVTTPIGLFESVSITFGLRNASQTFQEITCCVPLPGRRPHRKLQHRWIRVPPKLYISQFCSTSTFMTQYTSPTLLFTRL